MTDIQGTPTTAQRRYWTTWEDIDSCRWAEEAVTPNGDEGGDECWELLETQVVVSETEADGSVTQYSHRIYWTWGSL